MNLHNKIYKEAIKFLISGGISAIITLITLNILLYFNIPLFSASIAGYGAGIINSFFLNKKWTFEFDNKKPLKLFISFLTFNIIVMILFGYLNLGFFALTDHKFASQILSLGTTTLTNFIGYKFLIFKQINI